MRWLGLILLFVLIPLTAAAQQDDKGVIVSFLEENLSGAGREITIDGFQGALSSRATMSLLSIADDQGVWLVLEGATIDWNRAALFSGRVEVRELSAERLQIIRPPVAAESGLPAAEAGGFRMPELPVAVSIETLAIRRAELGPEVLGQAAALAFAGQIDLANGAASADLALTRLDGPEGEIRLALGYDDTAAALAIELVVAEASGGLIGNLLALPGSPSIDLTVAGDGPIADFTAEIALATDGTNRLAGAVTLQETADGGTGFAAELGGDLAPLVAPAYRDFLGNDMTLVTNGVRGADGALALEALSLRARSLRLTGNAAFASSGAPQAFSLQGEIADPDGDPVTLPLPGGETALDRATLALGYDAAQGDVWRLGATATNFKRPGVTAAHLQLSGGGSLVQQRGGVAEFDGLLDYRASTVALDDAALQAALGENIGGTAKFAWREDTGLKISDMSLGGSDYRLTAAGALRFGETGPAFEGTAGLVAEDLSRYSALVGQDLTGAARLTATGQTEPLAGLFDLDIALGADGLGIGVARINPLLQGPVRLTTGLKRDETGTFVNDLKLESQALSAAATGQIGGGKGKLDLQAGLSDLGLIADGQSGPIAVTSSATEQRDGRWRVAVTGNGPYDSRFSAEGFAGVRDTELKYSAFLPDVAPLAPGQSGSLSVSGTARDLGDGEWQLAAVGEGPHRLRFAADAQLAPSGRTVVLSAALPDVAPLVAGVSGAAQVTAQLAQARGETWAIDASADLPQGATLAMKGTVGQGASALDLVAQVPNIAAFVPGLAGLVRVTGTLTERSSGWLVDLNTTGPGAAAAKIAGTVPPDASRLSLAASGTAPLGLANRLIAPRIATGTASFDLRLDGPPQLGSLGGTITTSGARLSLPTLGQVVQGIGATVRLVDGRAVIEATAGLAQGGSIRAAGTVGLTGPQPADLRIDLGALALVDPDLYRTTVNGALTLNGPLAGGAALGGQLTLGPTEIRIPDSGFGFDGSIPEITHINEPRAVFATRQFAGAVIQPGQSGSSGPPLALDITINAPQQIFVRGRGLDAELGGVLRLTGTTANVVPVGGFSLIRGRMDVLTKRLVLDRGTIRLQGGAVPVLDMAASATTSDITVIVEIAGPADNPTITFLSQPELPQDEVLALLFFGKDIRQISPLQAAQMAAAVRTLQGKGGGGVLTRLRESFGLDDLDVSTSDSGETQLRVGKYLSDNIYTDVTTGAGGTTEINLNIDLRDNVTVKGSTSTSGESSVGIFFERDY